MALVGLPDNIPVWNKLPDEEKKQWMSGKEISIAFPLYVWRKSHLYYLFNGEDIRTKFFMEYTESFIQKIIESGGALTEMEYNCGGGSYYKVIIRIHRDDVKRECSSGGYLYTHRDVVTRYDRVLPIEASYGFKEGILDVVGKKIREDIETTFPTRFFNQPFPKYKVLIDKTTKDFVFDDDDKESNINRMFFGYLVLGNFIKRAFLFLYGISESKLETLLAVYAVRFFRRKDLVGVHKKSFNILMEKGYIEKINFTFDSKYKFTGKFPKGVMYTVSSLGKKIIRDYMDYMLLNKRLPELGKVLNDFGSGVKNKLDFYPKFVSYDKLLTKYNVSEYFTNGTHLYFLYKTLYEYVNSNTFFRWLSEDELKRLHNERIPFRFNNLIWEASRMRFLSSGGKEDNSEYISKYFSSNDNFYDRMSES
jgi:hypothetical protein